MLALVAISLVVQTAIFVLILWKMLKRFERTLETAARKTAEVEQRLRETRQILEQERKLMSMRGEPAEKEPTVEVQSTEVEREEPRVERTTSEKSMEPSALERRNAAFAEADMAAEAFGCQCCIEAYFHGRIAQLMGHRQIQGLLSNIRIAWRQMGYRSEKALVHPGFDELQSSIGRAMIRIDAKHDAELGYACLRELAEGGNRLARDFLGECGRE